jgi:hypothetical protein
VFLHKARDIWEHLFSPSAPNRKRVHDFVEVEAETHVTEVRPAQRRRISPQGEEQITAAMGEFRGPLRLVTMDDQKPQAPHSFNVLAPRVPTPRDVAKANPWKPSAVVPRTAREEAAYLRGFRGKSDADTLLEGVGGYTLPPSSGYTPLSPSSAGPKLLGRLGVRSPSYRNRVVVEKETPDSYELVRPNRHLECKTHFCNHVC